MTSHLKFPVLAFWREFIRIECSWEGLTTTTKAGLKNGMFNDLLLVDSEGRGVRVINARKLHGVGLFWGYNIFLNQRIRVELVVEEKGLNLSLEEVKTLVFASFRKRCGWRTRGDFNDLCAWVKEAKSVAEIITALTSRDTATRS
jgi:hypothetical protein